MLTANCKYKYCAVSQARSQTSGWGGGGGAVPTKVGRTKKKEKKSPHLQKLGTLENFYLFSCGPPLVTLDFCLSGRQRPEILSDFCRFAPKARAKNRVFKQFPRRPLMYISKWEFRGGGGQSLKKLWKYP